MDIFLVAITNKSGFLPTLAPVTCIILFTLTCSRLECKGFRQKCCSSPTHRCLCKHKSMHRNFRGNCNAKTGILYEFRFSKTASRGIEPLFSPWEGDVLTAWPTSHNCYPVLPEAQEVFILCRNPFLQTASRGIEPLFSPWEGDVLTAWPTSHSFVSLNWRLITIQYFFPKCKCFLQIL